MIHPTGKEIIALKVGGAIFWNIIFQIGLFKLFVFIVNINLSNPFLWFKNVTFSIFCWETWLYVIPLIFVTFAQGIVSCREYLIPPVSVNTRLSFLKQAFSIYNLVVGSLYAYIGLSIPFIYSSNIQGYSDVTVPCGELTCLSENKIFLILGGMWTGLYYFIHNHLFRYRSLSFPFIQRQKFFVAKGALLPSIKSGMKYTFAPIAAFIIVYYFEGRNVRNIFTHLFGLNVYPGDLDSFSALLDLGRLFYLWLFSSLIVVTLKMMEVMVKLFLTQHHPFPTVINPTKPSGYFILEEALMRSDVPVIQHLGYLDLVIISEMDASRRKEIFTLSQPGGHPYTWNGIKKECFFMINTFTASLNQALKKPIKTKQVSKSAEPTKTRVESVDYFINTELNYPVFCTETVSAMIQSVRKFILDWLYCRFAAFMELKAIKYVCGEVLQLRINYLLLHSLPVVWAAESLSHLVCFSLTEDEYGIVQNDIPLVVSCLLQLKNSLESLSKQPGLIKKSYRFDESISKMHNCILLASKRSLYRIAVKFRPYISDLQLAVEDEKQMGFFLNFRE